MRGVLATMERELRSYFLSPLGWVVATGFIFFNGLSFQTILSYLLNPQAPAAMTPLDFFFGGTIFFWLSMLAFGPVLTMRLLAEERRSGTLEMLLTAPISEGQVVIGKYLGAFIFFVFLWLPSLVYVALLAGKLPLYWGPIAASYLGVFGIGGMFLAIGVFTSAITRNQVVAAVLSLALTFFAFLPAFLELLVNDPKLRDALGYVNLYQHMDDFSKGIVDSRRLVYYLSVTAFFLFLASRAVEAGKGK